MWGDHPLLSKGLDDPHPLSQGLDLALTSKNQTIFLQHAKKVVSNSPGLVDFAIALVNSVLNLPDGQVTFFEEFNL